MPTARHSFDHLSAIRTSLPFLVFCELEQLSSILVLLAGLAWVSWVLAFDAGLRRAFAARNEVTDGGAIV